MNLEDINMVKALVDIEERANRVLSVVKAKYNLKDKSDAINFVITQYEEGLMEPALRPEFVEKMKNRAKEPIVRVNDFKKHFGLK